MAAVIDQDLETRMKTYVGRYADKVFDWDAFPGSRGYPELERAQIRYIGAGGSPKVNDPKTLQPGQFTLSIVCQPIGKYAASHSHEVKEAFLVLQGVVSVFWEWDREVIRARLGPKDMVLNAIGRPHGFKNEGIEPVLMSIQVGKAKPKAPPDYLYHPKTHSAELSAAFGALPGKTFDIRWDSDDPRHQDMTQHIVRYSQQRFQWNDAGFAKLPYIGDGGAPIDTFREDLIHLPRGAAVRAYERPVEDAYFVLEGCITVGWEAGGKVVEQTLGPRDLILNPPGQLHYFKNDGASDAQFMMLVGSAEPERVTFRSA